MMRLILMSVLCLTSCAPRPEPFVPAELTRPVVVTCETGTTSRALGDCTLALREGLNAANDKLARIGALFPAR